MSFLLELSLEVSSPSSQVIYVFFAFLVFLTFFFTFLYLLKIFQTFQFMCWIFYIKELLLSILLVFFDLSLNFTFLNHLYSSKETHFFISWIFLFWFTSVTTMILLWPWIKPRLYSFFKYFFPLFYSFSCAIKQLHSCSCFVKIFK